MMKITVLGFKATGSRGKPWTLKGKNNHWADQEWTVLGALKRGWHSGMKEVKTSSRLNIKYNHATKTCSTCSGSLEGNVLNSCGCSLARYFISVLYFHILGEHGLLCTTECF